MDSKPKYISIFLPILGGVFLVLVGVLIALTYQPLELRHLLARWTVLALELAFVVSLIGVILNWVSLREEWRTISRLTKRLLAVLFGISFLLVCFVAPRTNRIYFDEHIYQNIAQGIAWKGEAYMCNEGNAEFGEYQPFATEYNKQPIGHAYYLAIFFRLFGIGESSAHAANNFAYLLTIGATFALALFLFQSEVVALLSALFVALTPMVIIWSNTTAAEPSTIAFSTLALASSALFIRRRETSLLWLAIPLAGLAVSFRAESMLLLAPLLLIVLILRPSEILQPRFSWAGAALLFFVLPSFLHLYAVRSEPWGSSGERFSFAIFFKNIQVNGPFYFLDERFPLLFTIFAFIGAVTIGKRWRECIPVLVWFLYSFGIFLFFYAGSYNYGADVRFSLISAPALAILSGLGAAKLFHSRFGERLGRPVAASLILALIFGWWMRFLPLIRAVGLEAFHARYDVEYARELSKLVPPDSIVLTHNPSMWLLIGKNAAQTSTAMYNQTHVDKDFFARYKGGVFFHWNFWCNVSDPGQTQFCEKVMRDYPLELVQEYEMSDYRYALYRMSPRR